MKYLKRIRSAVVSWTIVGTDDDELNIDPNGDGFFARVNESLHTSHGMITFHAGRPELVGVTIAVPESTFRQVQRAFEMALLSSDLRYGLSLGFLGFRIPEAQTETPTWHEFFGGRPYFFEEISVWVAQTSMG